VFTKRNRIYVEVDAISKEDAYWKATSIVEDGVPNKDYDMTILGPTNLKVKELV
jgi:hypothetical protein